MTARPEERQQTISASLVLAVLILLAFGLRFWRLGSWSFDSDEVFMLRDSLQPRITNPRPLLYFLNHYLVAPLTPLDEHGMRLLPAVFGVLAIPVFYYVTRRLLGTRAALFGAFLLTVSSLHVYYSQFARYWSLVFLLSCVYPYAIYLGLRERSGRWLALGAVTAVLAILAHPASILLWGGLLIWAGRTYLTRQKLSNLWSRPSAKWGTLIFLVILGIAGFRMFGLLQGWISEHDTPGNTEFLLSLPPTPGFKESLLLLAFVQSLTFMLTLTGLLGLYLLWRSWDRSLALLLVSMLLFPIIFLLLLSFRTAISTFYLIPTIPVIFMGAGFFLDRLAALEWDLRPSWVLPVVLALAIATEGAPTLISQYRDGRRYDFRGAARWIEQRMTDQDVIFSDQYKVVAFYLPGKKVERLQGDPTPLMQAAQVLQGAREPGALWVVTPAASHAFRTNPKLASLNHWIYDHCQLRTTLGRTRMDFRQNLLQIFRCPPLASGAEPDSRLSSSGPVDTQRKTAGSSF